MSTQAYHPDFTCECRICGTTPCVVVDNHPQGDTELCGRHFFDDWRMKDWSQWNDFDDQDQL